MALTSMEEARIQLMLLFEVDQRTLVIGESCRVEDLDAGVMFPVERGDVSGAVCLFGIGRAIEPKAEVIELHGIDRHPYCCIGKGRFREDLGRRQGGQGNNESLDIEPADEIADAGACPIGDNVADIPG